MAGVRNVKELVDAELDGQWRFSSFRKAPTQTTTVGIWFDLSMSPGSPLPQYYAASPLAAIALSAANGGVFHQPTVSPATKYLRKMMVICTGAAAVPMPMILLDYLLYYPFIDESDTAEQALDNTVTLPRYIDGQGVQMMAVVVAAQTGGQSFFVTYTNQDGIPGRVSQTALMTTQNVNGTLVTTGRTAAAGPFIGLQTGDTGVRSIESVTMLGVDVGLFTIVLVKPLAQLSSRGIDAPVEIDYLKDFSNLPIVRDNAYLNLIACPSGTLASQTILGSAEFVWL